MTGRHVRSATPMSSRSASARCRSRSTAARRGPRDPHDPRGARRRLNLIDTADVYCRDERDVGHNERLIAKALRGRRDGVIVATKGGHTRAGREWELDCRPSTSGPPARRR